MKRVKHIPLRHEKQNEKAFIKKFFYRIKKADIIIKVFRGFDENLD